ncbi:protein NLP2-like [Arachis ipaensis]|uniref:Protein NLP2 n=1 Tax=Arachis hypogaea TaxID=3818 RepID=A0A445DL99_ARAHY|nr:protein NLP2-like [Arachis ipaensis]XP_025640218.1 protein NLP2 [Arachis hypogaea]QHO05133.1 hypothetical protein DS421_13g446060 [Arachis hypogaea]QHO05134.1 hypothetical protein DS421_13g446060 [Arachis hypogaea]RYR63948.1 hypothetical protein Ahy_A03g010116 [Arachis hypogaea]
MEYGGIVHNENGGFGSLSESAVEAEVDLVDELLVEGCWVETTSAGGCYNWMHNPSDAVVAPQPQYLEMLQLQLQEESSSSSSDQESLVGKRWWIGPTRPGPSSSSSSSSSSSVKERLVVAVGYLKDYTKNNNLLIQIWVPPRRSPLPLPLPLPLDVLAFPNPSPNPNPNLCVRFLRSHEYSHHYQAQQHYDLRGSIALPVFERGTATCLGVLDILITNHLNLTNNYRPQLDNVCNALEAVDFRSSHQNLNANFIPPAIKVYEELYQAALNEIVEVLTSVCKTQNLPLGLTWAPCIQQGKCGCGHSSAMCVSTVDTACYVGDLEMLGFQEACSEYHLFKGQGIVGTAFTSAKPCFAIDITAFSRAEYPLSHLANIFGLHAAVAIPLRSLYTGSADFVLEFFLPKDCHDTEQQKHMLNSLSMLVQQACRSLHVATDDDFTPPMLTHHQAQAQIMEEACSKDQSWIAHMMEAQVQQKGKGVCVSLEYQMEEPKEEFKVTTNWDTTNDQAHHQLFSSSDFGHIDVLEHSRSRASTAVDGGEESYALGGRRSSSSGSGGRKSGDKRRTKAEKTISLPVLRQYFAGSLKDAAKSIGVCPTTLKRICRQHGITRWPSRKIKKVGHSLKKLQLVIDSVQGAEGAIQIGSFYASFPELSSTDLSSRSESSPSKKTHTTNIPHHQNPNNNTFLKSPPSSACSQTLDVVMTESSEAALLLNRAHSEAAELLQHASLQSQEDTKHNSFISSRSNNKSHHHHSQDRDKERGAFRVKATFGDEKIRFSLQPNWGFRDLQLEMARRFNLNDISISSSNIDLKYLDEDGEWVLLACDADLEECKDIHRSSQSRTIRLSLFQASPLNHLATNTFGNGTTSPS